jgi:2-polyprenyl-3-methyl-5-hydroxy-6-metoxy-1,4-benzoquinol methylase
MMGYDIDCANDCISYRDLNNDKLTYPNDYFDYVICCEVIAHVYNPPKLIAEIRRALMLKRTL